MGRRLVFLASFPKSGNTWMRFMLVTYYRGREDEPWGFIDVAREPYDKASPVDTKELTDFEVMAVRPAAMLHYLYGLPEDGWALVKTHHASAEVGGIPTFAPVFCERAVVIVRDPRDILPSIADHMGRTLEEAAELMANTNSQLPDKTGKKVYHLLGSWSDHVTSWLRQKRVKSLMVRYEDMHADAEAVLRKVLTFIGEEEIDPVRLRTAVEANKFEYMQQREEEIGFQERSSKSAGGFFRRGIVGSHKDEVPEELIRKIEEDHGQVMEQMGYDLYTRPTATQRIKEVLNARLVEVPANEGDG